MGIGGGKYFKPSERAKDSGSLISNAELLSLLRSLRPKRAGFPTAYAISSDLALLRS